MHQVDQNVFTNLSTAGPTIKLKIVKKTVSVRKTNDDYYIWSPVVCVCVCVCVH